MISRALFGSLSVGLIFAIMGIWATRGSRKDGIVVIRWAALVGLFFGASAIFATYVTGHSLAQEFAARRSWWLTTITLAG